LNFRFVSFAFKTLTLSALANATFSTAAQAQAPALVVDASTGQVIISEDATRPWNPASTTKMMTAYVALRMVKSGQVSIDTPLIASANAAGQKPSKLGIRAGQSITLDNALKVLMVKSANDVAVVIAEALGGSVQGFSAMMNAEARRLGMNESRFFNPHGFHAPGHQSSARDLAVLAMATLRDFPEYSGYWGIGAVQIGNRVLNNTNGLIGRYSGANGFKTGFVCASGFNLVSMATRGGRTLIAVVLGASSGGERVVRAAQLLDQGFSSYGGGQTLASLPSSGYSSAPDMRGAICTRRRRGIVLADDSDYGGAILGDSSSGESMGAGSPLAFFAGAAASGPARSFGVRSSGGRAILGPRQGITPIAIYYGPAPGSTAVALGPGGRRLTPSTPQPATATAATTPARSIPARALPGQAIPGITDRATALAPTQPAIRSPAEAARIAPKVEPAKATPSRTPAREDDEEIGQPMQLPGIQAPRGSAAPARPSAKAAIRPAQPARAALPQGAAQPAKAGQKAQPTPKAQANNARPTPALRGVNQPARPQPAQRKKATAEDDE
jgi:D-alanyl-D-alanine carboxypeptidase